MSPVKPDRANRANRSLTFRSGMFPPKGEGQWCRILDRNSCARSERGFPKKSSFKASSTISPRSMKTTRWATFRAKPISCVTTIMVMPSRASSTMTSRNSFIISGSSAEVGSSNSIAIGSMASARAIATRCCWPPESWPGYLSLWAARPTRSSSFAPFCVASSGLRPSTFTCASVRLRITVMCGNSSKFWNTMPILERSFGRSVFGSPTEMPSTVILPFWNGSRPLTHLMSVDLPLPEGPHDDDFAFLDLARAVGENLESAVPLADVLDRDHWTLLDDCDAFLEPPDQRRQPVRDDEIHHGHEAVHLDQTVVAVRDLGGSAEEVGGGDHVHERGVLEQDDGLREQYRQHVAERLRQDDLGHGLPVVEPERVARPHLAARDRLDARAHDLAIVRGLEHGEGDRRRPERADLDRLLGADQPRADVRHEEEEPEDHQHQGDRAHQVDVGARKYGHRLDAGEPHHRERGAEDDAAGHRQRRERERESHPLPEEVAPGPLDDVEIEAGIHCLFLIAS